MTESAELSHSEMAATTPIPQLQQAPTLSSRGLTIMLIAMCVVTLTIIFGLLLLLPPPEKKGLKVEIEPINFLPISYFQVPYQERAELEESPRIRVKNKSNDEWTMMNIRLNGASFQTYEKIPLPPGAERVFVLDRFWSITGERFNPRALSVKRIQIMARVKSRSRRTFTQYFDGDKPIKNPKDH